MTAASGTAPHRWSATGLPSAVTLDPTTGVLSGLLLAGKYIVAVTATAATGRTGTVTEIWHVRSICLSC
jgi:Putative Ig domain